MRKSQYKDDMACRLLKSNLDWIHIKSIDKEADRRMYQSRLHAGEVDVMILAREIDADLLIIDDNAAKKTAKFLGLPVTGTMGVLLKAKSFGIISEVKPTIDKIRENGFFITDNIYDFVLKQAEE